MICFEPVVLLYSKIVILYYYYLLLHLTITLFPICYNLEYHSCGDNRKIIVEAHILTVVAEETISIQ